MAVYNVDAMPVGWCDPGQELTKCTFFRNEWGHLGAATGCKKGQKAGVNVTCTGPSMSLLGANVVIVACVHACMRVRVYAGGRIVTWLRIHPFDSLNHPLVLP